MKKFFKYVLFGALAAALAVGFTGCYGEDIDNLQEDVANIKADISEDVVSIWAEIARLNGIIAVLQQAIENQNTRITQLENDLDLDNPDSAISLAIAQGDLATLNAAKAHAEGLFNALNAQIGVINGFLGLNTSGNLVVAEAAPNDMLNGTYANLNAFVRALAIHLATLKGQIDANAANIAALQTAVGANTTAIAAINSQITAINGLLTGLRTDVDKNASDIQAILGQLTTINNTITEILSDLSDLTDLVGDPAAFWADDLGINTVWEALGHNYEQIKDLWVEVGANYAVVLGILNRLDNLGGLDGRTLEQFVTDVDGFITDMNGFKITVEQFMTEMNNFVTEIQGRFDGFADGETIIDMIEKFVGDLTSTDSTVYPDATSMINGEIAKLDTKLTDYIDDEISDLRTELKTYIDEQLDLLKEELLGKMQDMVTSIEFVAGTNGTDTFNESFNFDGYSIRETRDFGPTPENKISFVAGTTVITAPTTFKMLVKINPVNAIISTATKFVLYDSAKNDYIENGVFSITGVTPYTGGVLTRTVDNTGLWVISFTVNNTTIPGDGTLLSLGVVNNMVSDQDAATPRVVSTSMAPIVINNLSQPVYYFFDPATPSQFFRIALTGSRFVNGGTANYFYGIHTIQNQYSYASPVYTEQIWDTNPPPGTTQNGDDRSSLSSPANTSVIFAPGDYNLSPISINANFRVYMPNAVTYRSYVFYYDFDDKVPADQLELWRNSGVMNSIYGNVPSSIIYTPTNYNDYNPWAKTIFSPKRQLHRELIGLRIQAVNRDGTLVDPDGIAFKMGPFVMPSTETRDQVDMTFEVVDYTIDDINTFFDSEPSPIDIATLGFDVNFLAGLTSSYSIALSDPGFVLDGATPNPGIGTTFIKSDGTTEQANNTLLGTLVQYDSTGAPTTDWSTTASIGFTGLDAKAFVPEVQYTGTLTLTEAANWTNSVSGQVNTVSNPIVINYPISITLSGGNMIFDTTMMNYKPNFGPGQITIWPVGNGTYDGATFNFADAFTNVPSANIVFEYLGTNTGDISTVNDPLVPENYLTIDNIDYYASTPANTVTEGPIEAYYIYGPVWENAYGDGNMLAPWSENSIGIEIRRYMDWYELNTNNDPIVISLGSPTLPASTFFFESQDPGRSNITLGGNMQFDGNSRIDGTVTVTLSDTQYFQISNFNPYGGNNNFTFTNIATVSLTNPVGITMTLEYTDDFGTVFTTAPFNVQITN